MSSLQTSIETLQNFIAFDSVSDRSNRDITDAVSNRLETLGFRIEQSSYQDPGGTAKFNLVARRDPATAAQGPTTGGVAYFCHTDVVPAVGWTGPGGNPFKAVTEGNRIYGRGACDMKGSLAAMLSAVASISPREQNATIWIVCTADEEVGFEGAKHLVAHSEGYREIVESQPLSIIGEPTRMSVVHAHKGISGFRVTSHGRAAHSSTRDGINANVAMVPMLQTLRDLGRRSIDDSAYHDNRFDPPTLSWNFGVSDGTSAVNITPERSVAWASLRPMPTINGEELIQLAADRAESLGLEFERMAGGSPFWIDADDAFVAELCRIAGGQPKTVCYGTDGGEFTALNHRVVFGPGDIAQAHTTDEYIELDQLKRGIELYCAAVARWCSKG